MLEYPEPSGRGQERRYTGQNDVVQRGFATQHKGIEGQSHRDQTVGADKHEENLVQLRPFRTVAAIERYKWSNQYGGLHQKSCTRANISPNPTLGRLPCSWKT